MTRVRTAWQALTVPLSPFKGGGGGGAENRRYFRLVMHFSLRDYETTHKSLIEVHGYGSPEGSPAVFDFVSLFFIFVLNFFVFLIVFVLVFCFDQSFPFLFLCFSFLFYIFPFHFCFCFYIFFN